MSLICGSVYAFLIFLIHLFLLMKRIKNEVVVLLTGLEGYAEYIRRSITNWCRLSGKRLPDDVLPSPGSKGISLSR